MLTGCIYTMSPKHISQVQLLYSSAAAAEFLGRQYELQKNDPAAALSQISKAIAMYRRLWAVESLIKRNELQATITELETKERNIKHALEIYSVSEMVAEEKTGCTARLLQANVEQFAKDSYGCNDVYQSSEVNASAANLFLSWTEDDPEICNLENETRERYVDPYGLLALSDRQKVKVGCWKRPHEFAESCGSPPVMISCIDPLSVKQESTTDCSFIASLCVVAAYEKRFGVPIISNILYPIDPITRTSTYNPKGKYIAKLHANGELVKVVIDDYLPVRKKDHRRLLCSCTTHANELWVSLIEKAYLKINGGYDFPGGNSGVDIYSLVGWIPEQLCVEELKKSEKDEDSVWDRLYQAFYNGECIMTITTKGLSDVVANKTGLVPMHVYAVLDIREVRVVSKTMRLLQLKNPWRKQSWRGGDLKAQLAEVLDLFPTMQQEDDGLFWIDIESVKKFYDSFYVSWNPQLFPFQRTIHGDWPRSMGPKNDVITLGFNPQLTLFYTPYDIDVEETNLSTRSAEGPSHSPTTWILVTRHVDHAKIKYCSELRYLTFHVYKTTSNNKRVFYNQDALYRGSYTSNPHILFLLDTGMNEGSHFYTLVLSQFEKTESMRYTVTVFSLHAFQLEAIPPLIVSSVTTICVDGEWRSGTAGGRPALSSFMLNPQYQVHVSRSNIRLYFILECLQEEDDTNTPEPICPAINLRMICDQKGIVKHLASPMCVLSSGDYRPWFCYIMLDSTKTGDYVLIPSTFEANVQRPYRVKIVGESGVCIHDLCTIEALDGHFSEDDTALPIR